MSWIIGLMVVGLMVVGWLFLRERTLNKDLFRRLKLTGERLRDVELSEYKKTKTKQNRQIIAVNRFELMDEEEAKRKLAGRHERDPFACAVLSLLHEAKADAAAESNDPKNPEWLAQRCAGGLHWLLQFEAELKEAMSAEQVSNDSQQASD